MRPVRRTEKQPSVFPKIALLLSPLLFLVTFAGMLAADIMKLPWPRLTGQVVHVTKEGVMLIQETDDLSVDLIRAKPAGLDVSARTLELAVLNRYVECYELYEAPEFKGVTNCTIFYRPIDQSQHPALKSVFSSGNTSLDNHLLGISTASHHCSEFDRKFVEGDQITPIHMQKLYWVHILCRDTKSDE